MRRSVGALIGGVLTPWLATLGIGLGAQGLEPPRLVAKVDLVLGAGTNETRAPFMFDDVQGLAFGPGGVILVAATSENAVRVFTNDGRFAYQFGRKGQGPGDLNNPCCLSFAADGLLWIVDAGNRRLSIFRVEPTAAKFVKTISLPEFPSGLMNRVEWDATGKAYAVSTFRDGTSGQFGSVRRLVTGAGQITFTDTVPMPLRDSLLEQTVERRFKDGVRSGHGVSVISQPFGPRALRAFGPGGRMALAISSNYSVEVRDALSRRVALLRRTVTPPPLSKAEQDKAEHTLALAARSNEIPRSAIRLDPPKQKPPLRALGYDLDGRLWVQRNVPEGKANVADVYDLQGRWVQVVEWPADIDLGLWVVRGREGLGMRRDVEGISQPVKISFH